MSYYEQPKEVFHPVSGEVVTANYAKFLGTNGGSDNPDSFRGFGATSQMFQYKSEDGTIFVLHENGGMPLAQTPDGVWWEFRGDSPYRQPTRYYSEWCMENAAHFGGREYAQYFGRWQKQ